MKHTGYLFSFSALVLSVGTMGFFALDKTIPRADAAVSVPTEAATPLASLDASVPLMELPPVIELPTISAVKAELPKIKPKRAKITINVVTPALEKHLVCSDWHETAYGTKVRDCKMK